MKEWDKNEYGRSELGFHNIYYQAHFPLGQVKISAIRQADAEYLIKLQYKPREGTGFRSQYRAKTVDEMEDFVQKARDSMEYMWRKTE